MDITEVRIFPREEEKLKAYVSVTFDNSFVVRGIKIIQSNQGGLMVFMPSRKQNDGTYEDIAHPINKEMREFVVKKVLSAYEDKLKEVVADVSSVDKSSAEENNVDQSSTTLNS